MLWDDEIFSFTRKGLTGRICGELLQIAGDEPDGIIGLHIEFQVAGTITRTLRRRILLDVKRLTLPEFILARLMPSCETVIWPLIEKCLVWYGVADGAAAIEGSRRERDTICKAFELILEAQKPELLFGQPVDLETTVHEIREMIYEKNQGTGDQRREPAGARDYPGCAGLRAAGGNRGL